MVVGCAGSGKSTLARRLASASGLAVVERDGLGKENSPEFHAAIQTVVASDRWIFDGQPYFAEEIIFGAADTVVIFDLPKRVVLARPLADSHGGVDPAPLRSAPPAGAAGAPRFRASSPLGMDVSPCTPC